MAVAENHHSDWKRALAAPVLLLLAMVLFYWKITLSRQYTWLESPDFANQVLPWFQFQAAEWHRGHFPLWEAYQWGGQPLTGQAQPGSMYPLNWLLFLLPLRDGFIRISYLHWYYVLIHYMGGLFCYWLCRDLGRSRAASLLAAIGFSLGGWMGSTEWPQMLNGAVWAPLLFLFQFRAMQGLAPLCNAALAGACLGMAFLSGHHQIPVFMTLASAGAWLYHFARHSRRGPVLLAGGVFASLLFLVSAAQTLPAYEYGQRALRWVGSAEPVGWSQPVPYPVHIEYGLRPLSLLGTVVPGIFKHADPYIGFALLSMALLGVATVWREWQVRVLAAMALGGLLYSLAQFGFIEGVIYALVPVVEKARTPSMAVFMFHFSVVVISAYGIDSYMSSKWLPRLRVAAFGFAGAVFFALLLVTLATRDRPVDVDKIAMAGFTALLLPFALGRRYTPAMLAGLIVLEAGLSNNSAAWALRDQPESYLKKMAASADIAAFLRRQNEPVRVEIDRQALPFNFGDWFGIDHFGGNLASLTSNVYWNFADPEQRKRFGVNFCVGSRPPAPEQTPVFKSASGLDVYRIADAGPRVWTDSACTASNRVRVAGRTPGRILIDAEMACEGVLVLAETYFPGWQARVDSRPAPVKEAYGVFQSVQVGAGRHRVEMVFRPASVLWGGALSLIGLLAAAYAAVQSRRAGPGQRQSEASAQ